MNLGPSLKKRFPFRLATTSFIYPGTWAENVRRLAPLVDEIELLFFESTPQGLPSPRDIGELEQLGHDLDVGFNVHLPTDISLGDLDTPQRFEAAQRISRLMDLCTPLAPVSFTLHLPAEENPDDSPYWRLWQDRCRQGIETLLQSGLDSRLLAVETLVYPAFALSQRLVSEYDLSVCLDMGHLLLRGQDPLAFYRRSRERISIVHLHGVQKGRDHLGLESMGPSRLEGILRALSGFTGTVSLEVFCLPDLQTSLSSIEGCLENSRPSWE